MTWRELLTCGQKRLKEAGIREFELDGWYLFSSVFGISRTRFLLCAGEKANADAGLFEEYEAVLSRRCGREPLQYILGTQEFMGLEFLVNPKVLIPRQDTETLVELVLAEHREKETAILDMCTGSGCIAVSLAVLGGYAHVEGADLSADALAVARRNAEILLTKESGQGEEKSFADIYDGIPEEDRHRQTVRFRESDLFSAFGPGERFDVIVSNPPYIPTGEIRELEPEVRDFEPRMALDGTGDGLFFYRRLTEECRRFLRENGAVYFEIGYDQGEAVRELLLSHGFTDIRIVRDLAGNDRVACGCWRTGV